MHVEHHIDDVTAFACVAVVIVQDVINIMH